MNLKQRLNEKDLERIKAAVKNAEEKISGEIVPVLVERSGDYLIALYKGSLIGAAFTFVSMVVLDRFVINDAVNTLFYDPVFILLIVILGGVLGAVTPSPPKQSFENKLIMLLQSEAAMGRTYTKNGVERNFSGTTGLIGLSAGGLRHLITSCINSNYLRKRTTKPQNHLELTGTVPP